MTTQPSDEETLIAAARAERGKHRSGGSMAAMLGIAVAFGVVGGVLVFLPAIIRSLLPWPLAALGGFSVAALVIVGVVAFTIAGFFLLAAFASSPLASWGNAAGGNCPSCGEPRLRSDTVPGLASDAPKGGPRGIVTLCESCDYATASVTRPSGAAAA